MLYIFKIEKRNRVGNSKIDFRLKMKQNNRILFVIMVSFLVITSSGICSAATNILFYETGKVNSKYRIGTGYSVFEETLVGKGYSVSRIEIPLTREALRSHNPDVLVIANLDTSLEADELAAVFEFVMQDGKGLFIAGGGTSAANQITIPFGMKIDEGGTLEDETSPILNSVSGAVISDKTNFVTAEIEKQDPSTRLLIPEVNSLAFFRGNGIQISGEAKVIVSGDTDTYSPKSPAFPKGSKPPIVAASMVGNGLVLLLSDADMLINSNLDTSKYKYDNLRFGTNIIDWLRSSTQRPADSVEMDELQIIIDQQIADRKNITQTITNLNTNNADLQATIVEKEMEITTLSDENTVLRDKTLFGVEYSTWAISFLVIVILFLGLTMLKKKKKKKNEEDEIDGFGYEFEDIEESDEIGENTENFEELMDDKQTK